MDRYKKIPYIRFIPIIIIGIILFRVINSIESFSSIYSVVNPFIWAFALAYILNPMVRNIEKEFNVSRGWSILITYIFVFGILTFVITIITPNIVDSVGKLVSNSSKHINNTQKFLEEKIYDIEILRQFGVTSYIEEKLVDILKISSGIIETILNEALIQAINVTSVVLKLVLSLIISIYFIKDKEIFFAKLERMLYAFVGKNDTEKLIDLSKEADEIFSKYLIGKLIDSIIIGIICFIILFIMKIPYALLISSIIGITNMIPYFGPIIGAVPSVIITLFTNPFKAFTLLIVIFVLQQFDGLYLGPKILGGKVGLGAFWVITAVTIGGALFGPVGMFLGVPVMAVLKLLMERYIDKKLKDRHIYE